MNKSARACLCQTLYRLQNRRHGICDGLGIGLAWRGHAHAPASQPPQVRGLGRCRAWGGVGLRCGACGTPWAWPVRALCSWVQVSACMHARARKRVCVCVCAPVQDAKRETFWFAALPARSRQGFRASVSTDARRKAVKKDGLVCYPARTQVPGLACTSALVDAAVAAIRPVGVLPCPHAGARASSWPLRISRRCMCTHTCKKTVPSRPVGVLPCPHAGARASSWQSHSSGHLALRATARRSRRTRWWRPWRRCPTWW